MKNPNISNGAEDIIQNFALDLLKQAGIDNMPEEFKKEYLEKLAIEAERRLGVMAMEELDAKGLEEFEAFMSTREAPKSEEFLEFFNSHISDFSAKANQTLQDFAKEFLSSAADLKSAKI
ncbi:MAG: DUF5663 domain-containing protein [Patescibacteria group bacterium]